MSYISTGAVNVLIDTQISTGTAGAGSLIIEFGVLSRLTGDSRFEKAAYKAFFAIWNGKSDLGLVGNTINAGTGVGMQAFLLSWMFSEGFSRHGCRTRQELVQESTVFTNMH